MQGLMQKRDKTSEVQCALSDLVNLCDEVKGIHGSLMGMLPLEEKERHDIWFKAKMLSNNDFISEVKRWVSCAEHFASELGGNRQPGDIFTIMQRQNEITAALVQQQHLSSLPEIFPHLMEILFSISPL